jgi:O-antigen/teichoic acid export membrane protein
MKPAEDVGIYGAAYKIIDILIALPAIFVGLVVPILSRYYTENREKFNEVFRQSFNVLFLVSVPIAIGTQFVASWIIVLVGGPKFADSAPVLQILIIAVLGMFISTLATNTIVVINKQRSIIWTSLYAALSSIILNFILIPPLTYIGASMTTVITEFSIAVMTYAIVYRSIRLRPELIVPLKAILAGAVMWGVFSFLASDSPFLNVFVGGTVYVSMIFVLRAIRIHEVKKLIKISEQPHV